MPGVKEKHIASMQENLSVPMPRLTGYTTGAAKARWMGAAVAPPDAGFFQQGVIVARDKGGVSSTAARAILANE